MLKLMARLSKTLISLTDPIKRDGVSKVFRDETNQAEVKSDMKSPISQDIDRRSVSSTSNTDQQDAVSISTTEFSVPIDQSNLVSIACFCSLRVKRSFTMIFNCDSQY